MHCHAPYDHRGKYITHNDYRGKCLTPYDHRGKYITHNDYRGKCLTPYDHRGKYIASYDHRTRSAHLPAGRLIPTSVDLAEDTVLLKHVQQFQLGVASLASFPPRTSNHSAGDQRLRPSPRHRAGGVLCLSY